MGGKKNEKSAKAAEAEGHDHDDEEKGIALCQPSYPHRVFLIIASEFCERFCYYGMKAVLQTYLMMQLGQDESTAASLYHAFAMVAYFTPLPGAILADSFIGKYWTIVSLSIVYVIGNVIMAATAIDDGILVGALVGMFTIAVGTGGIKPCVSSFGADQFTPNQSSWQNSFFSMFYISINAGALISMFVTPLIKGQSCFGQEECWVLAFGLPAALMVVALIFFLIGTPWYTRAPVTENVALKMAGAVYTATKNSFGKNKSSAKNFLDRAVPKYSQQFVDDCRAVFRVLALFLPLPFFWALFDQTGSRWLLQAQKMTTYIDFLDWHLEAEQLQILNSIMVVIFVPIFDVLFYPLLAKCNLLVKPLQRMISGCALAAISFIVIGFIQLELQNGRHDVIDIKDTMTYRTRVFNEHPQCTFDLYLKSDPTAISAKLATLEPYHTFLVKADPYTRLGALDDGSVLEFKDAKNCMCDDKSLSIKMQLSHDPISSVYYKSDCSQPEFFTGNNSYPLSKGEPVAYLYQILVSSYTSLPPTKIKRMSIIRDDNEEFDFSQAQLTVEASPYRRLNYTVGRTPSMNYKLRVEKSNGDTEMFEHVPLYQGGEYTVYLTENSTGKLQYTLLIDKEPNGMSAYWQVIPYLIITWAEIPFSITGLSFAFSQAPASMKSILTAGWLLTPAFGNLIDLIIILIEIPDKAVEFFIFAGMMVVVTVIFAIMAYFYKYVEDIEKEKNKADPEHEHHTPHATALHGSPTVPYIIDPPPLYQDEVKKQPYVPAPVPYTPASATTIHLGNVAITPAGYTNQAVVADDDEVTEF